MAKTSVNAMPVVIVAVLMAACGGSGSTTTPNPSPGPAPAPVSPCGSISAVADQPSSTTGPERAWKTAAFDSGEDRYLDDLWKHRARSRQTTMPRLTGTAAAPVPVAQDIGEIAVIQDRGDVILPQNIYDLRAVGLRFTPNGAGGYSVSKISGEFRTTLGTRLTMEDDDSVGVAIPFGFSFYGRTQTDAFVNSDGNMTFGEEDSSSSARNVSRLLTGPPRVAPFLADLDPSAGGGVFVNAVPDQFTVTWCGIKGFESQRATTTQATLLPDGTIELKYSDAITLSTAVVGVSPGRTGNFAPVDLSAGNGSGDSGQAIGERFSNQVELDSVAVSRRFYEEHPDLYDQILIWTDTILTIDAFAYESTVANEIRGIGQDLYDVSRDFGSSGGRLRSVVVMDWLGKYGADPSTKILGENTTLSILGQEVGHRWLAFVRFRDRTGQPSDALLGRGKAHWSFFFDSDASVMEGNDIEDLGGGSFRTVDAVRRFSALDRYAMGLVPETAVPPFFYVESPTNISGTILGAAAAPKIGVTFNGTRRDVLIQDVIAIEGPRLPASSDAPKVLRQAFIYVVGQGRSIDAEHVAKLERIRLDWGVFFEQATDGLGRVETRLRPPT